MLDAFVEKHPATSVGWVPPCAIVQREAGGEFSRWLLPPIIGGKAVGARWLPLPLWPGLRAQLVHSEDVAHALQLILTQRARGPFNLAVVLRCGRAASRNRCLR